MLENLIGKLLQHGAGIEDVLRQAVGLSRESFQRLGQYEKALDQLFGSSDFRKNQIDPLLEKERQIDAIKSRVQRGGPVRTSDRDNLGSLLRRRAQEYQEMHNQFPWSELANSTCGLITEYIQERRTHLLLGDADRVRAAFEAATTSAAA